MATTRCAFSGHWNMPQMQQEESRMTFPLRWASMPPPVPYHRYTMVCKEYAEGVKPHAAVTPWAYVRQKSCSQSCVESAKLNTRRMKVSNESMHCWVFKMWVRNQKIIWSMVYKCRNNIPSSYINVQNFLFDTGWSPCLDIILKNCFIGK